VPSAADVVLEPVVVAAAAIPAKAEVESAEQVVVDETRVESRR
jgi:hypothetical protein